MRLPSRLGFSRVPGPYRAGSWLAVRRVVRLLGSERLRRGAGRLATDGGRAGTKNEERGAGRRGTGSGAGAGRAGSRRLHAEESTPGTVPYTAAQRTASRPVAPHCVAHRQSTVQQARPVCRGYIRSAYRATSRSATNSRRHGNWMQCLISRRVSSPVCGPCVSKCSAV